jgi:valyl-tRNA synthetase
MTQTPPYAQEPTTATRDVVVPDKPALEGLEATWSQTWKDQGTYVFDRTQPRESVYSIDTPPPTASGALHVGHVFSYTHADLIARFQRMRGKTVFYPMGWDDNGLPTERRVQNFYGVRCDPSLPYDPDFTPPDKPDPKRQIPVSRPNFVELCEELIVEDEKKFEELWRTLGLSVDWDESYTTIGEHAQRVSQTAFLRNFARGEAYLQEAPTLWDVTFRTAVAQAELEAREYPGAYHRVAFHRQSVVEETDGRLDTKLFIETTRPELIAACVALIAHPDDERYADLIASGATVTSPVFGVELPVLAHEAAEPDKGSGLVMCCTFGDLTDVQWWRELNLPVRTVIGRDGRVLADTPEWLSSERASRAYAELAGKTTFSAREAMVAMLRESGDLDGEPKPTQRMTNFYEKGDKPLEIVSTRQWYIRNGGRDGEIRAEMLARGAELDWVPEHMRHRYDNWVKGLNGDWLISRQRFFGVPLPGLVSAG